MDLFDKVSEDIKNAMKAKDKVALETLRNVKKCFLEAKTAPGANDTLTDADALKIMQKLVKQGKDSASIYEQQGRADLAEAELGQVRVIERYLPKQMSAEELEAELRTIIAQVGAAGPKDMGKVMGVASKALAGKAEGRAISETVKRLAPSWALSSVRPRSYGLFWVVFSPGLRTILSRACSPCGTMGRAFRSWSVGIWATTSSSSCVSLRWC